MLRLPGRWPHFLALVLDVRHWLFLLRWPAVVFLAGVAAAWTAAWWQKESNDAMHRSELRAAAQEAAEQLRQRMLLYERGVRSARSVVLGIGPDQVTREAFHRALASRDFQRQYPGIRAFGFVRRVPAAQEAAFVQAVRSDGNPDFRIKPITPHSGERFVLQLVEPLEGNAGALGVDMASEPARREVALAAMHGAGTALSAPLLVTPVIQGREYGFLLVLPIYRTLDPPLPSQRDAQTIGWAVGALFTQEVLHDFIEPSGHLALALSDTTQAERAVQLFTSAAWHAAAPAGLTQQATLDLYGRRWLLEVQALPSFIEQLNLRRPVDVVVAGILLSALLALLTHAGGLVVSSRQLADEERAGRAAVVDSAHDAIVVHTLGDEVSSWNAGAQRLLGWAQQDVLGQSLLTLTVPAERQQEYWQMLERVGEGQDVPPFETVRLDRSRHALDVVVSMAPIRDRQGRVTSVATTMRDIRSQRAAQAQILSLNATLEQQVQQRTAELHALAERERAILAAAGSAIVATDAEDCIVLFNPAAERLTGRLEQEVLGKKATALLFDPQELRARSLGLQVQAGGHLQDTEVVMSHLNGADHAEWQLVRSDGARVPVLLDVRVLHDGDSTMHGLVYVAVDLSERKRLEEALRQRTQDAEAASRAKSSFLANMSHEIRTPLHGMLGMAGTLAEAQLPPRQRQQAQLVLHSGRLLLGLIDDILDFSRIEAGQLKLEHVPMDLSAIAREAAALFQPMAARKGLALRLQLPQQEPAPVLGDPLRLSQILNNLLSNAVKFTSAGGVDLCLVHEADERWRFVVRDSGIGLTAEQQARIFEPFTQADGSTTRRFGGSGLGLSIVRHLAQLHGGMVGVHSQPGQGAEFWVVLTLPPAAPASQAVTQAPTSPGASAAALTGKAVLVAEDNEVNMQLACMMLEQLGLHARPAPNGDAAVRAYAQGAPDIVLMDMHMPIMDGLEATRCIRALEAQRRLQRTPIVALTASALAEDRQRCKDAGMDDVLVKPFDMAQLTALLERFLPPEVPGKSGS
ncbi:CHASE domain-containing protein [Azohydromonas australica]|uniref:CHASE domain-containing protein n=1 Tax=Azohydromonas australica TaxID=364039 RepID=UPI000418DC23|nr:CHASE domain-containing protein [Azohydromonas australica]